MPQSFAPWFPDPVAAPGAGVLTLPGGRFDVCGCSPRPVATGVAGARVGATRAGQQWGRKNDGIGPLSGGIGRAAART